MYAKRNNITIALLLLIILIGGFFWYRRETKQVQKIEKRNVELTKKLDGSLEIAEALESTEKQYRVLKQKWDNARKIILAVDEPSFSLNYLNWLINNHGLSIDFDFVLDNVVNNGDITTFTFTISGEGSYRDIYRLILFLTENPLLYQIESFFVNKQNKDTNLLDFKIQIKGFSLTSEWKSAPEFTFESMRPVVETSLFHDAFKSISRRPEPKYTADMFRKKRVKPLPKPKQDHGVDIEQATLQAVANKTVYIKDKNGKLTTLKVGDKVRSGKLTRINKTRSEVEFILYKNGRTKKVILGLDYKK